MFVPLPVLLYISLSLPSPSPFLPLSSPHPFLYNPPHNLSSHCSPLGIIDFVKRSSVFNPSHLHLTSFYPPFYFTPSVASAALGSGNQTRQIFHFPPPPHFFLRPNVDPNRAYTASLSPRFTILFFFSSPFFLGLAINCKNYHTSETLTRRGSFPVLWFQLTTNNLFTSQGHASGQPPPPSIVCVLWPTRLLVESKPRIGNTPSIGAAPFSPTFFISKRALLTNPP